MVILLKRYRLGPSPSACDDAAAASASRSFRSSLTTAASAVGFTCVARVCRGARVPRDAGGTHALVAEAREDLERRTPEIRVEQVAHFLHGCVGVRVERWNRRARTHHREWLLAGLHLGLCRA